MKLTNQGIALAGMVLAASITFSTFTLSRQDHDLKLMSLTACISLGSGLLGIAGTLLVGAPAFHSIMTGDKPVTNVIQPPAQVEPQNQGANAQ